MTSFSQVYGSQRVKVNFVDNPKFWRHGVITGESATHLFFEDKYDGIVSIPFYNIKDVRLEKKPKEVTKRDLL